MLGLVSSKPAPPLENTHECVHSSVGERQAAEGKACHALEKWSYDASRKTWSKPDVEPLLTDKLDGLELELSKRWGGIVDRVNEQAHFDD